MGAYLPIPIADDARACRGACAPGAEIFAEVADRIQRSMRQGTAEAPVAIGVLVADALEHASGARIRDQARLARQMLLWHNACPPEQARALTVAALADRAGALRRSVPRRRHEGGAGE
jgi:hypothetical protein